MNKRHSQLTSQFDVVPDVDSRLLFLRKFLRHGRRVASVAPSSRALAAAMCEKVDPERPQTIVELGPGTGPVTEVAIERMHPSSRLIALELDQEFAGRLEQRCPRAWVVREDAAELGFQLKRLGVGRIDLLINGLPTPSLPKHTNGAILKCFQRLSHDAWFSQLTVMPWVFQGLYRRVFERVDFHPVWQNIPPGGVYHCRGLRPNYADVLPGKG